MGALWIAQGILFLALPHLAMGQSGLVVAWSGLPFPGELLCALIASALAPYAPHRLRTRLPHLLLVAGAGLVLFEAWCLAQGHVGMNAVVLGLVEEALHTSVVALWVACLRVENKRPQRAVRRAALVAASLSSALWYTGMQALHLEAGLTIATIELISWGFTLVWAIGTATFLYLATNITAQGFYASATVFAGTLIGNRAWWLADAWGLRLPLPALTGVIVALILMCVAALFAWQSPERHIEATAPSANEYVLISDDRAHEAALSIRERQTIELVLAGLTIDETATELGVARATVASYRSRALAKLGASSMQELLAELRTHAGIVHPQEQTPVASRPSLWDVHRAAYSLGLVALGVVLRFLPSNPLMNLLLCLLFAGTFISGLLSLAQHDQVPHNTDAGISLFIGAALALTLAGCTFGPSIYLARRIIVALFIAYAALSFSHGRATLLWFGLVGCALVPPGPHAIVILASAGWATGSAAFLTAISLLIAETARDRAYTSLANASLAGEERTLAYLRGRGLGELEAKVALLSAQGFNRTTIASALSLSLSTVASYRAAAYQALNVSNKADLAVKLAVEAGFSQEVHA